MSSRTLLLTVWYFPQRILRWQDAVKMVYEGTADVVVEYEEEIRSPSTTWRMPAVVRLRRSVKERKGLVKFSRANLYQRDDFTCQYCGRRFPWHELTYDHLVPRSRGGQTTFLNIVTACRPCNARKDAMTCDEAGMFPLQQPQIPEKLPLVAPHLDVRNAPPEWDPFIAMLSPSS